MIVNEDIKRIFGSKYYEKTCRYIETMQKVIDSYDVIVFMARKAYCFYKALLSNNLLKTNDNSIILSSRAATHTIYDLSNKKIAIIEDVVILGQSLNEVIAETGLSSFDINIFMFACSNEFLIDNQTNKKTLHASFTLIENDLLELATLVTNYIVFEGIPYNTDYPIYKFTYNEKYNVEQLLREHSAYFISDYVNCKKNSMIEAIIPINETFFSNLLPHEMVENTVSKIRLYIDYSSNTCYAVPIVFFTSVCTETLENTFNHIFSNKFQEVIISSNSNNIQKNKLRILCYSLADLIMRYYQRDFLQNYEFEKINSDFELFFKDLSNYMIKLDTNIHLEFNYSNNFDNTTFYNALGFAYDLLISNFILNKEYQFNFKNDYISFENIKEAVSTTISNPIPLKVLCSLIVDIFIDNGVIVPRVHQEQNSISRIFKFGEVAKLTEQDFILFAIMLGEYCDVVKRDLDKTEMEKISVLFFRKYSNNFNVDDNESEAYRICYSKFGPRISSSEYRYSVPQGKALMDILIDNGFVIKTENKYTVIQLNQNEKDNKIDYLKRNIFANKLGKMYEYYRNSYNNTPNDEVFIYINSFIRLLTLLAIGPNEHERLLSLVAEVDLIKNKKLTKFTDLSLLISVFKSIIDGVLSGVWKYFCYKNKTLLNRIFHLMVRNSGEENAIYTIDIFLEYIDNSDTLYKNLLFEQIGTFLYDVALLYAYICRYKNIKMHEDYNKPPYKHFFTRDNFPDIYSKYDNAFYKDEKSSLEFISNRIKEIDLEANNILDQYHIYENDNLLSASSYRECIALFNIDKNKICTKKILKYRYFMDKDILIIPTDRNRVKDILDELGNLLEGHDMKALYYISSDEHRILYANQTYCFGGKFIEELHDNIEFIRREFLTLSQNELFCANQRNGYDFETDKKSFVFLEEKINKYTSKYISMYQIKEKEKMNITNYTNNGDTIFIENFQSLSSDLDKLYGQNAQIDSKLEELKTAISEKDQSKIKKALIWLKENALEIIKDVGASVLSDLIIKNI